MVKQISIVLLIIISGVSCKTPIKKDNIPDISNPEINSTIDAEEEIVEEEIVDTHSSQTSVDWIGIYKGTLPCSDCKGIETILELKADDSFELQETYLGMSNEMVFANSGNFKWSDKGDQITFSTSNNRLNKVKDNTFKVGENRLLFLDPNNKSTPNWTSNYVLTKIFEYDN